MKITILEILKMIINASKELKIAWQLNNPEKSVNSMYKNWKEK
jgi:hypothetical protein